MGFKVFLYAICILLSAIPLASALGLSGGIFVAQVSPGEHIKHDISISTSKNESSLNITINILDMLQGPHGETLARNLSASNPYSARSFLRISPSSFHIEPGGSQKVLLEGDVPSQAGPGGKYAVLNIRGSPNQTGIPKSTSGVNFVIAINGIVELMISKEKTVKTGTITKLGAQEPVLGTQQNISMMYNNTGNIQYNFKTNGALMDENKRVLANASTASGIPIMPGALRFINFSLMPKKELQPGTYDINATVRLDDGTVLASKETEFKVGL